MDTERFTVVAPRKKKKRNKAAIVGVVLFVIAAIVIIIATQFQINEVEFSGNEHYTDEEMLTELKKHNFIDNSLIYTVRSSIRNPGDIPFIESYDVEYVNNHKISVTVYEKSMVGCVENMGEYMYFDKDGMVLESNSKRLKDVPLVKGLNFESMVVGEPLPFEDKKTVGYILNIAQLIKKYELEIDTIKFDNGEVFLLYKKIVVALGSPSNVDEKLAELPNLLKKAKGMKGTLHMENFTVSSGIAAFDPK
ncbi:MAG: cell division protein FtsQ/DivIB [Lachnospiraceae bacterium]|nr:cell division protein FtsQ/DivIB [Lachnospiraceae bacterium]